MEPEAKSGIHYGKVKYWLRGNMVPLAFLLFTLCSLKISKGTSLQFFLLELSNRFFRNIFLVLSLVIPVIAGLGLNFGIVIGAMAGQAAIAAVRFFHVGGVPGLLLCAALSIPIAALLGFLTGTLYNKTRGQEMIASLIVGFFANGLYQFIFLYLIGGVIPADPAHYMIKPDGVGLRATIDMGEIADGGLKYALNGIMRISLMDAVFWGSAAAIVFLCVLRRNRNRSIGNRETRAAFGVKVFSAFLLSIVSGISILSGSNLTKVKIPVATSVIVLLLCVFTQWILGTKLGQDFRSVGQSQHIADVSGINVDQKRVLAVIISTVAAALGQIIYLQDMGTFSTYSAHSQIGLFSVAALLVGGASIARANIWHAIIGTLLFHSMFIMSPEIGEAVFGQVLLGEYFRTFMVYGVIGVALGVYVWDTNKRKTA